MAVVLIRQYKRAPSGYDLTAACKSASEHLLVAALVLFLLKSKKHKHGTHSLKLLKGFHLFKVYLEMSEPSMKCTNCALSW